MAELFWSIYLCIGAVLTLLLLVAMIVLHTILERTGNVDDDLVEYFVEDVPQLKWKTRARKIAFVVFCVIIDVFLWPAMLALVPMVIKRHEKES